MSLDYRILPEAREDIDDAHAWYESQAAGRGDRFLLEVHDIITTLRTAPELYGFVFPPLRAAPLPTSQFIVYYTVEPGHIEIVGVLHANADPKKWQDRV